MQYGKSTLLLRIMCGAVAGSAIIGLTVPPARASFLDSIFASPSPPAASESFSAPAPVSSQKMPKKRVAHRRLVLKQLGQVVSEKPMCCKTDDAADAFMNDPTLRRGDAVMTKDGIRIFEGPVSTHHAAGDFVSLEMARNVGSKAKAVLSQVDAPVGDTLPAEVSPLTITPNKVVQWKLGSSVAVADR